MASINLINLSGEVTLITEMAVAKAERPLEFRFRLSSKHLILASPVLEKMYSGDWKEATERNEDGLLSWNAGDYLDPKAFSIVMGVIHGRNRKVPRSIDLETLAKVAVVTDYLQCHEAMEIFSTLWIGHLESSIPHMYCRELMFWIMMSSIFQLPDVFTSTTRTAILHSNDVVTSIGLPIHDSTIGKHLGPSNTILV